MRSNRSALACVLTFLLAFSLFSGCGEVVAPGNSNQKESENNSLESRAKIRARTIESWTIPELIGTASLQNAATGFFHGPMVSTSANGSTFVRWRTHTDLNPFTGQYMGGVTAVLTKGSFGAWQPESPVPPLQQSFSTLPDIVTDNVSGQAYAVWVQNQSIYASVYSAVTRWSQPVLLGQGKQAWIVRNAQGGAAAMWVRETGINQFVIEAKRYQTSNIWSQVFTLTRNGSFVSSTRPQMDASGQILLAWQEEISASRGIYSATLSSFGWSNVIVARPPMPLGSELIAGLELVTSGQPGMAQMVVHVTDAISGDGLFAYDFQQSFWSTGQNIDDNLFNNDRTQLEPFALASNARGDAVVAWVEEQRDNINTYSLIYVSRYIPMQGWTPPEAVSAPVFRGPIGTAPGNQIPTYLNSLDAVVDSVGEMTLAWVENSPQTSELFTAHFMANTGWNVPELVTTYPGPVVVAEEPDLALRGNSPVITWRKANRTAQAVLYEMFFAGKLGGPGSIITPSPINPTQPKPPGHIASTNQCNACHFQTGSVIVDHTQVIGPCESCHFKSVSHLPTTSFCASCHMTTAWVPAIKVDHAQVVGTCESCHNGVLATGKSAFHIPSSNQCAQCHSTLNWFTTTTQPGTPVGVITPTTPRPANHIPATNQCFSCHIGGSPTVQVVDHSQVIGSCSSCHNNFVAMGKSIAHLQTTDVCEACHSTTMWIPAIMFDHNQALGSCFQCHNGVTSTGKSPNHIASSNQCEQCHTVQAWFPAIGGTPINSGPTGNWSMPVSVWSSTTVNSSNDYVHGPQLKVTDNNLYLSLVKHSQFNGFTGRYELGENHVYYSSEGTAWREKLPAPRAEMLNASMVQIQVSQLTGNTYALWSKQGELFFSEGTNQGTWTAPTRVGAVDGQYYLLLNNEVLTAVWRRPSGPNQINLNARVYRSGTIWGETRTLEVSDSAQFSRPVVDAQGRVFIARQELLNNSSGGMTLYVYVNDFTQATGWSQDKALPQLPVQVTVPISLDIAATGQGQVFAIAGINGVVGFNDSGLYAYAPNNPFGWQNLISLPNTLSGKPKIVSNVQGEAMAVWVQGQSQGLSGPRYNVYSSRFSPMLGNWEPAARLGNLNENYESDPTLLMRPNGEAIAAWVSDVTGQSVLYTKHYTPQIGWASAPQPVVVNQLNVNGYTVAPDIAVTPMGATYIAWKQMLVDQANTQYSIWVSNSATLPF
ncbi:MAG: hypothetical protein OEZ43_00095 [Gammaproteobacteria bacterium]|nr:hypothetical protein [Gammaproteobacteria bacterium]